LAVLDSIPRTRTRTVDFVVALNARIAKEIGYVVRMEPGVQTLEETFERATASCRDRDYSDVAPVKGILRTSGSQTTEQSVDVVPLA
jgi:hypothetical protein